jgi:hypothetical protein
VVSLEGFLVYLLSAFEQQWCHNIRCEDTIIMVVLNYGREVFIPLYVDKFEMKPMEITKTHSSGINVQTHI